MNDYRIGKVARQCSKCNAPFTNGTIVLSTIVKEEDDFVRRDACPSCRDSVEGDIFSSWEFVYPFPEKPNIQDMEKVSRFFDKLLARPDPTGSHEPVKFFTALLLLRKKRLRLLGTRATERGQVLRFEKAWDAETVEVADVGISEEKLAEIRASMEQLFQMELSATKGENPGAQESVEACPSDVKGADPH